MTGMGRSIAGSELAEERREGRGRETAEEQSKVRGKETPLLWSVTSIPYRKHQHPARAGTPATATASPLY